MRLVLSSLLALAALAAVPAYAETIGGNPGPAHNYVCPHADGKPALDCYFDAVQHLYTMCRNVKSIEILEFGYEKSTDGANGKKSESCLEKQKQNIERPYRAALKEALHSKQAVEALRHLQETWLEAMSALKWRAGESDADYKARVAKPYEAFNERIVMIRTDVAEAEKPAAAKRATTRARTHGKSAPKDKATPKDKVAPKGKTAPKAKTAEAGKP
ncbi:MAG TPA: hypothetical protein VFM89_04035 [Casimicrobiaceae bacterium]|nr:hypothetical protein [Casimicrobiaceae bacterium]